MVVGTHVLVDTSVVVTNLVSTKRLASTNFSFISVCTVLLSLYILSNTVMPGQLGTFSAKFTALAF